MIVSNVKLVNWKNFQSCDVRLSERTFLVGANASGKSNFLDAIRFLHDLAKPGGGLQTAVSSRGGMKRLRCLAARQKAYVSVWVQLAETSGAEPVWEYRVDFVSVGGGVVKSAASIARETVCHLGDTILDRTKDSEDEDGETLKYTHLEQAFANKEFRDLKDYFEKVDYLNVVPQLVRESNSVVFSSEKEDYYGRNFLQRLGSLNENTRKAYFNRVGDALKKAVPQLADLSFVRDEMGTPHLEARYEHWRAQGSKQREDQFSDGTIRLIGFLFAVLDNKSALLLEEPESNLHTAVVSHLPELISRLQRSKREARQVIITTHSYEMLDNEGIGSDEVLLLCPSREGTTVVNTSEMEDVRAELEAGFTVADALMPLTKPDKVEQLSLF